MSASGYRNVTVGAGHASQAVAELRAIISTLKSYTATTDAFALLTIASG
jgi:hypothetical protein